MSVKQDASDAGTILLWGVVFILIIGVFSFVGNSIGLWQLEFFGTKKANIERNIFDNTKSQVQGTIQALSTYRLEYKTATTEAHKSALREAIILEYDAMARKDLVPGNLVQFIESIR